MPSNPNESPEQDHTSLVLNVLADFRKVMREDVDHLRAGVAELKGEQVAQGVKLEQAVHHLAQINGKLVSHAGRLDAIDARHSRDDGFAAGRKAERERLYVVARIASKPATWAWGAAVAAVAYVAKDRAG